MLARIQMVLASPAPNQALQRTRRGRRGCNRCVPCAGSLICVTKLFSRGRGPVSAPQPPVNNFAATKFAPEDKSLSGRIALRRRRSSVAHPARVQLRTPPGVAARAPTSERTTPHEGPDISKTPGRPTVRRKKNNMHPFAQHTHYVGLDWAKDHHDAVIVDQHGTIVADLTFSHDAPGWESFRERVKAFPSVGVAIETNQGAAVTQLLQSAVTVYPVAPRAAKQYRERKAPSGTKTDYLDAWGLADALRVDGHGWRALRANDPLAEELRLLCRDEVELITKRTALVNQ